MPSKSAKPGYYAVKNGRDIGIYHTWAECEAQTTGYNNAQYKKFSTIYEAQKFISPTYSQAPKSSQPVASQPSAPANDTKGKKHQLIVGEVADTTGWEIVYSDGACKGNGKQGSFAGVGVWWGPNDERNIAERCPGDQTNNRAELIAILRVLETTPISPRPLLIRTDSQYCINCFKNWIFNWMQNGWTTKEGVPVKNAEIIRCVSASLSVRAKVGQRVHIEYVKGHSGDVGNDGADLMANRGCTMPLLADRNWKELEDDLEVQLNDMDYERATQMSISVNGLDSPLPEHRDKVQKLSQQDSVATAFSSPSSSTSYGPTSTPNLSQYSNASSQFSAGVEAAEVNFDDFADCLLDDDDLASELVD